MTSVAMMLNMRIVMHVRCSLQLTKPGYAITLEGSCLLMLITRTWHKMTN